MGNNIMVSQIIKNGIAIWPREPTSGCRLKELKVGTWTDVCTLMFTATLVTTAKRGKQPKCPLREEWINKTWFIHTMGPYSALKRREILTPATTRMNLEDIMLKDIRQSQEDKQRMIPLIGGPQSSQVLETKSRWWLPDAGGGEWLVFNGDRVSVLQDEMSSGDGWWWWLYSLMNVLSTTEQCTTSNG